MIFYITAPGTDCDGRGTPAHATVDIPWLLANDPRQKREVRYSLYLMFCELLGVQSVVIDTKP